MIFSDLEKNRRSKILNFLEFRLTAKFASKLVWISKILLRKFKTTFDPRQKGTFWCKGSLVLMFLHIEKMGGSLGSVWIVFFTCFILLWNVDSQSYLCLQLWRKSKRNGGLYSHQWSREILRNLLAMDMNAHVVNQGHLDKFQSIKLFWHQNSL